MKDGGHLLKRGWRNPGRRAMGTPLNSPSGEVTFGTCWFGITPRNQRSLAGILFRLTPDWVRWMFNWPGQSYWCAIFGPKGWPTIRI